MVGADVNDRVLVECYANEMACAGGLSESVSYGWALDAFLADPTEFRERVHALGPSSVRRRVSSAIYFDGSRKF